MAKDTDEPMMVLMKDLMLITMITLLYHEDLPYNYMQCKSIEIQFQFQITSIIERLLQGRQT